MWSGQVDHAGGDRGLSVEGSHITAIDTCFFEQRVFLGPRLPHVAGACWPEPAGQDKAVLNVIVLMLSFPLCWHAVHRLWLAGSADVRSENKVAEDLAAVLTERDR